MTTHPPTLLIFVQEVGDVSRQGQEGKTGRVGGRKYSEVPAATIGEGWGKVPDDKGNRIIIPRTGAIEFESRVTVEPEHVAANTAGAKGALVWTRKFTPGFTVKRRCSPWVCSMGPQRGPPTPCT
jgi:hypothetical protein